MKARAGRGSRCLAPGRSGAAAQCALALAILALAGCGASRDRIPPGIPDPDRVLYERGLQAVEDERWLAAREDFRQVVDNYPQSQYRADAKLGVGDSYLGEGTTEAFVLAVNEFREFLTFYPTHPRADVAQYKLALTYYRQMLSPDRDQTQTKEAVREFETFIQRYPNSQLLGDVRAKLREVRDRLAESEYRVGLFYYRTQWYPGAIDRFKAVLQSDPEFTRRDAVYFYLAESLLKSSLKAEALPYYERLVKEFVQSEYLSDAQKRIAELKGS